MERLGRLIIIALVTFFILKSTTFGWRFFTSSINGRASKNKFLIDNLKGHVYKISHELGYRSLFYYDNLEKTADYLRAQLTSYGYEVLFQEYILENKKVKNVIATKKGRKSAEEVIVVGAHYDSCFNPGANDNASGIAGLLELARFMADKEISRTIKFIAFVNEEPPFFKSEDMGSRVYARKAKREKEDIKAAIILETIGYYTDKINSQRYPLILGIFYPNRGNFISVVGNFKSGASVRKIAKVFKKHSKFPISSITLDFVPGGDFSDHWSFWKEGYPAVMVTDTAFLRYPHYHLSSDTWEKLNYENLAAVIEGFYPVLMELGE